MERAFSYSLGLNLRVRVTWTTDTVGLANKNVRSLLAVGGDLFAGTVGGMFRSTDRGATWTWSSWAWRMTCLPTGWIHTLAAMGLRIFAGTAQGVYMTTNGGLNWEERKTGLPAFEVRSLVRRGATLMAGTFGGGTYVSSDSVATWTAAKPT